MNQVWLEASINERTPIRYTPAGVPILQCTLVHRSEVIEAGVRRKVEMTVSAVVAGELSGLLASYELGRLANFIGFLASRNQKTHTLIFHITELQEIHKD